MGCQILSSVLVKAFLAFKDKIIGDSRDTVCAKVSWASPSMALLLSITRFSESEHIRLNKVPEIFSKYIDS